MLDFVLGQPVLYHHLVFVFGLLFVLGCSSLSCSSFGLLALSPESPHLASCSQASQPLSPWLPHLHPPLSCLNGIRSCLKKYSLLLERRTVSLPSSSQTPRPLRKPLHQPDVVPLLSLPQQLLIRPPPLTQTSLSPSLVNYLKHPWTSRLFLTLKNYKSLLYPYLLKMRAPWLHWTYLFGNRGDLFWTSEINTTTLSFLWTLWNSRVSAVIQKLAEVAMEWWCSVTSGCLTFLRC